MPVSELARVYFALNKVRGKQIKRSLKASDSALARRCLSEFRTKAHELAGEDRGVTFKQLVWHWVAVLKPGLCGYACHKPINLAFSSA